MWCRHLSLVAVLAGTALFCSPSVPSVFAQNAPWIAEPETGTVGVSFVSQRATEYYAGSRRTTGSLGGANLSQNTVWFGVNYAFTDALALDVQTAWSRSFLPGPVGPTPQESFNGLGDSNVAVTWRLVDELISNSPSVALRGALIAAGNYETGYINSLGDGAHGAEVSVIVGQFWDRFGFSTELGYRHRGSADINELAIGGTRGQVDVPSDLFYNLSGYIPAGDAISLAVDYRMINGLSGLDIGGPGFSPARFPALEEELHVLGGRVLANVTDTLSLNFLVGHVVAGRNTARSFIFGLGASFGFGGGGLGF
ncbi:MAG: hypothetical protein OXQ28_01720 [Acidobacteriota bacterium]|nr:hypothetical protein [Acidobacteriota bacterium]